MAEEQQAQIDDESFEAEPHAWSSPIVQTLPLTAGPSTTNPKAPATTDSNTPEPARR